MRSDRARRRAFPEAADVKVSGSLVPLARLIARTGAWVILVLVLALPATGWAIVMMPTGPGPTRPPTSRAGRLSPELDAIRQKIQAGGLDAGIEGLEKLVLRQPSPPAYGLLGEAYLAKQRPGPALEAFRKLIALAPRDPEGPYLAGLALQAEGKRVEARQEFEAALALAPGFVDALGMLLTLDFADRQPEAALERVRRQIALVPRSGALYHMLAKVHEARREPDLAVAACLKAIELEPRVLAPYLDLADLRARSNEVDKAAATIQDALRIEPNHLGALMLLGTLAERQADVAGARAAYEKALTVNPRFAPAANNLAYLLVEQPGDTERALKLAQTARALAPTDPRVMDTLGWILYRRGAYQQAFDLLKESVEKLPQDAVVHYHLGMAAARAGDHETAKKALGVAVGSSISFPGKAEARKTLEDLR
jgi:tetratricopeptide (TPR) repeat protein